MTERSLREDIGRALVAGDCGRIARGYEALVDTLVERRDLEAALAELREGLDILSSVVDATAEVREPAARLAAREGEILARISAVAGDHLPTFT